MRIAPIVRVAVFLAAAGSLAVAAHPSTSADSAWSAVAKTLQTTDSFTGGYHRYNFPRRDISLTLGDVKVAPELALGAWAGFAGRPEDATMMGDLVLKASEERAVLAEIDRQGLAVTAIHSELPTGRRCSGSATSPR